MGSGVSLVLWPPDRVKNIILVAYRPEGYLRPVRVSAARPVGGPSFQVVHHVGVYAFGSSLAVSGSDQAYRTISIGQLNALLRLHLRPIDVVVYHGPQGYLVLRGASRLDAFSGYPVRS